MLFLILRFPMFPLKIVLLVLHKIQVMPLVSQSEGTVVANLPLIC